jgi:hypothetical protein
MRNIFFYTLFFLSSSLAAMSDFMIPRVNPRWEEIWIYSDDSNSILYDWECNAIIYKFHMWKPWEMTHSPWCHCHDSDMEIDDSINAEDY